MNVKRGFGPRRCFIYGFEDHLFPECPNKRRTICDSSAHNHTTVLVGGQEPEEDGDCRGPHLNLSAANFWR